LAASVDSLEQAIAAHRAAAERHAAEPAPDRSKQEELQKENQLLKEQLDKANQELERIKRRLAPAKP
jgi:dynactin complex subunit